MFRTRSSRHRALLVSLAFGLFGPVVGWPQSAPAVAPEAPSPFEGRWRLESSKSDGEGLWIFGGKLRFVDRAGYRQSQDMSYRIVGNRLEVERQPDARAQLVLTLQSDDRLVGHAPGEGEFMLTRDGPRPPAPAPRTDTTPIATGAVAPVRGRYVAEGRTDGGMEFLDGVVRFLDTSQPGGASLPFQQQGAKVTIYGPHMNETLVVLQDGRLRLVREGMVPMHFRKSGR